MAVTMKSAPPKTNHGFQRWSFALLLIRQAASASVLSRASVIFAGSRA